MKTMEKNLIRIGIALLIINIGVFLLTSCAPVEANNNEGFRQVWLYGYECITNDRALWCRG
jgi:hypothetical protein